MLKSTLNKSCLKFRTKLLNCLPISKHLKLMSKELKIKSNDIDENISILLYKKFNLLLEDFKVNKINIKIEKREKIKIFNKILHNFKSPNSLLFPKLLE